MVVKEKEVSMEDLIKKAKDITAGVRRNLSDLQNCSRRWRGRRRSMKRKGRSTEVLIMRRQTNMERKEESVKRVVRRSTDVIIDSSKNLGPINNHYLLQYNYIVRTY